MTRNGNSTRSIRLKSYFVNRQSEVRDNMQPSQSLKNYRSMLGSENFKNWDRFENLRNFVNSDQRDPKAQFSILTIDSGGPGSSKTEFEGHSELAEFLTRYPLDGGACRLILVENPCPETVALLHEQFQVEPEFFARHVNNENWFRVKDLTESLPDFPSKLQKQNFLHIRWTEVLSVYDEFNLKAVPEGGVLDFSEELSFSKSIYKNKGSGNAFPAWRGPDKGSTRTPRLAEKIKLALRPGDMIGGNYDPRHFHPLLCARYVATIRFVKHGGGWVGIFFLDPVLKTTMRGRDGKCFHLRSLESPACNLPSLTDDFPSSLKSSRRIIADSWNGLNTDSLNALRSDCFMTLHALYNVVAHNWIVLNEYIGREVSTIEYFLETSEPAFAELEAYLKAMYCHRRRCVKYCELIAETKNQCATGGQKSWHSPSNSSPSEATRTLERDFAFLQTTMLMTERRIDKNIDLLTALVAIGEGKLSLEENKGITRLTLFATIFIPSSTVGTILGMEDPFGPGSRKFSMFWAVAIPLTAAAMMIVFIVAIRRVVVGFGKKRLRIRTERNSIGKSKA